MYFKKTTLAVIIGGMAGLLGACTMTPQDVGSGMEVGVGGAAVDGYLAHAKVFVDSNENGILDSWEPTAFTDGEGYFSYNPSSDVNYCTLPGTDSRSVYCLRTVSGLGDVPIRMTGGYDRITNEPFVGTLTVRVNVGDTDTVTADVVGSPLTSLYNNLDAATKTTFLAKEFLTEPQLAADFFEYVKIKRDRSDAAAAVTGADVTPIKLAWRVHKVVDVIASRLEESFPNTFGKTGQEADASRYVYKALADALAANYASATPATDLADFIATGTNLQDVITAANLAMAEKYTPGSVIVDPAMLATWGKALSAMVDSTFAVTVNQKQDVEARGRAIEVVAALMRDTTLSLAASVPPNIQNAIDLASDAYYLGGDGDCGVAPVCNLRDNKADIADLTNKFATATIATLPLLNTVSNYSGRKTLAESFFGGTATAGQTLSDQTLSLSDPTNATQTAALTFSHSEDPSNTTSGTLEAVINFSDAGLDIGSDPTAPLTGSWEQVDDYSMLVNLDVADGVTMPVIVKTDPNGGYTFDLGGETKTWNPTP